MHCYKKAVLDHAEKSSSPQSHQAKCQGNNNATPSIMQFTHLAMAFFATLALGAPAADPSDIVKPPTSNPTTDAGPVIIGIPHGEVVPIFQLVVS
jgi:hypothetical protein